MSVYVKDRRDLLFSSSQTNVKSSREWERKFLEVSFLGVKVPGSESSRERNGMELSLPKAKVLRSESSSMAASIGPIHC